MAEDVPDAVFDDDYFEKGKRVPISELKERSCLCPANTGVIIDFAARAIMKELHGIPVDADLDERQEAVKNAISGMINASIDRLRMEMFAGNGIVITTSWL